MGGKEITEAMRAVASSHGPTSGRVLPKCKVMQNGCVLVGIDCPDSLAIARALVAALPGADTYYANQRPDQQLITLGRFAGSDAAGFAAWLSESLAGQRTLLPELRCVSVQLSEEAHPFPNPQIALTGMSVGGGDGVLSTGLGPGIGLGLNLSVGLGLGGGFGGFDSAPYASSGLDGGMSMGAAFGAAPPMPEVSAPVPVPAPVPAPPMPSTPPPQSAARVVPAPAAAAATPPSYASAIGTAKASPGTSPTPSGPTVTPVAAMPPPRPPGGSFAQRAAAGVSAQPSPARPSGAPPQVQTPEQLLTVFQQMTSGAEGSGVLCTGQEGGYALRPQNASAWSQRLAPLVGVMQSTLANVGAARFLAMIDRVANPYGTSLAAELGPKLSSGARLEIVQDANLLADVENTPVVAGNQGTQVRLVCCPVNQAVVGAAGHSNTGSCIVVGALKDRGVDAASGLLRVAPLALNLEPIANVAPPADAPYLTLTFAWLGLRSPPSGASEPPAPIPMGAPAQGASVRRPGDWTCARCSAHNFASRQSCFKCKRSKAGGDSEGGDGFSPVASKAGSDAGGPSAGSFRAGDWICKKCRAHNFASRQSCFKCEHRKTGDEVPPPQSEGPSGAGGATPENFRSGDWICEGCQSHNFASRSSCFRCARPA